MNDEQSGPPEPPTVPVPPVPPAQPPTPPAPEQGPIDWTPRNPAAAPPPPPAPPQWSPPAAPAPPAGPPTGPPTAPPSAAPAAWNQPPGGAPAFGAPGAESSPTKPPTSRRTGLIIGVVVVVALVIGGIAAAAVVLMDSGPNLELNIEACEIAADGTLTASGSVDNTSGDPARVEIEVKFRDDAGGVVDTDDAKVSVPGDSAARWSLTGAAGDQVQRVSCDVTVDD